MVHGIWDTGARFTAMRTALHRAGITKTRAIDLKPNDGSIPIASMAEQVSDAVDELVARYDSARVDLVGFSMGAVVSRYYVQRLGGRARVRRFVSIAGPHAGTVSAFFSRVAAGREMRPKSALLAELDADESPWGECEVHSWITPFDLMIVPPRSGYLRGSRTRSFNVAMHRFMITDSRVHNALVETLR
jgi:triacylglycerol esterase/lipase EstA (alpha/beta hydrolase family)